MEKAKERKNPSQEVTYEKARVPKEEELEQLAIVTQLMGADQVKALCEDGKERQFRIPGKLKKRVWLREDDVIIVKLWDFQPEKGDVIWRYFKNQVNWLKKKGYTKKLPI